MNSNLSLEKLGWTEFFDEQLTDEDQGAIPKRVSGVHRTRLTGLSPDGEEELSLTGSSADFAVGDWVLCDTDRHVLRRLDRHSLIRRKAAGHRAENQLIAANVDTLFIVTSCNADFNPARLERYLSLAAEAGTRAVILITKADTAEETETYVKTAQGLQRGVVALAIDARGSDVAGTLADWCGPGQTVALLGSSGVGKTTLTNALTGGDEATAAIREDDARGRHTTTSRALHPVRGGGWIIDTPGMRSLPLADVAEGIDTIFAEITELTDQCKFRDCAHESEPGCAVQAAIADGRLDPDRVARWKKLKLEDQENTQTLADARAKGKALARKIKEVTGKGKSKRSRDW